MNRSPLCRLLAATSIAVAILIAGAMTGCGGANTSHVDNQVSTIPEPTISTISPTSNVAGNPAFTLSVNGASFLSSSVVNFGGTAVATTFVSSTQLTAAIPAAAIASAGPATVTVTNPGPGGGTSSAVNFTINATSSSSGAFTPTGSMTTARAGHTATLLPNGKVLIAGGYDAGLPNHTLASAELYDPSTGKFTPTGSMTTARAPWQTATLLTNGKVLIAGGSDGMHPLVSAELYDPSTGMFTPTGSMTTAEVWRPATLLTDGRVFVVGTANAEIYDPATGTFTSTGAYTTLALWGNATTLVDGRVLLTGCVDWVPGPATGRPGAELFDPRTGAFSVAGPLAVTDPGDCQGGDVAWTATLLRNSTVLLVGSVVYDIGPPFYRQLAQIFNPTTGTFTTVGSPGATHEFSALAGLPDGTVLITGGQLIGGDGSPASDLYLPATGTFASAGNMTTGRHSHTATLLPDGTVLITGGYTTWPTATASAEIYKP